MLLSDEYLATRTRRQARRAINDLSARHEVHVVVTVRDLGRVLTSSWAEDVKSGSTVTWPEYVAAVRVPERSPGTRPAASGCGRTSRTCSRCGPWRRAPTASTSSPSRHRARGPPSCSSASDRSWGTTPPRCRHLRAGPTSHSARPGPRWSGGSTSCSAGGSTSGSTTGWSSTPSACTCARPAPHAPRCPTSTSRGRVGRRRDWSPRSATAGTTWWATSTTSPHERPRNARRTRRPRASCSRRRWRRCGPSPSRTPGPGGCAAPARRCGSGGAGDPCDPRAPVRGVPHAPQGGRARRPQRGRVGGDGGLPHGAAATVRATTATVKVASTTAPSTSPVTPPNRRTA